MRRYGTSTTTLKNRIAAFSAAVASSTVFHSPSNVPAPFNTAFNSAPVQRFTFGSYSTRSFLFLIDIEIEKVAACRTAGRIPDRYEAQS